MGTPFSVGAELADKKGHAFLVNFGMCPQILFAVCPEGAHIGQVSAI